MLRLQKTILAVGRARGAEARLPEAPGDELRDLRVVFDDEHVHGAAILSDQNALMASWIRLSRFFSAALRASSSMARRSLSARRVTSESQAVITAS